MWQRFTSVPIPEFLRKKEIYIAFGAIILLATAAIFPDQIRSLIGVENTGPGSIPKYRGRPVGEYRPVPEDVRLFTEEQRSILRQQLLDLQGSIDVNPDLLDPWLRAGVIKKMIGDFEGARDAWEYASLIRPKNSISFKNLGDLYWHYLPDYPRAEKNLRTAIENDPAEAFDAYLTLSDVYRYSYTEKASLADDVLLEGLEKAPKYQRDLTAALARYYQAVNDIPNAIMYYEELLKLEPGSADVMEELRKLRNR